MASYLLIIANRKALSWILTARRMAFPSANRPEVRDLAVGDELFIYTTRTAFHKSGGRIIGTARVASDVCWLPDTIRFGGRGYPIGCNLDIGPLKPLGQGVELTPLVPQLGAFQGAGRTWSMRLRKPLLRLTEDDTAVLRRALSNVKSTDNVQLNIVATYTRWFDE